LIAVVRSGDPGSLPDVAPFACPDADLARWKVVEAL
jgi:hypothetical protein